MSDVSRPSAIRRVGTLAAALPLAVLAIVATVWLLQPAFVDTGDPIRYVVSVPEDAGRLRVEARLTLEDRLLHTTHEGPDPKAYAPYLRDITARTEGGETLEVVPCTPWQVSTCNLWKGWERGRKWRVDAEPGTPIVLSYDVVLEHDPADWPAGLDSAAFRTAQGVYATGRALFVVNGRVRSPFVSANMPWMEGSLVPREDSRKLIRVDFELPEGWRASAPWTTAGEHGFIADDLIDLTEAMIMLGTHEEQRTEVGGTALVLALGGETVVEESEALRRAFTEAHAYFTEVLGGPPRTTREDPLGRAMIAVNSHDGEDGEVIGSNISVTFTEGRPVVAPSEHEGTLSLPLQTVFHELFHLWNGVSFVSAPEAEWFKEGVTDYYALRAARRLGYVDETALFALLGEQYRRHLDARAASELSLTEAGADEFGNHELLYPGGLLVGLSLDLLVRDSTGDERGLDDVMRRVYADYGASGEAVTTEAVRRLAEEIGGVNLDDFFGAHVEGTEPVPLPRYLGLAGLEASFEDGTLRVNEDGVARGAAADIRRGVF